MSATINHDYHGQEFIDGQPPADVPAMEESKSNSDSMRPQGTGAYSKVVMIGNYGFGCSQQQTLRFANVSLAQARKLKWDYYGVCGAQMSCYDESGNIVHEE